MVDKPKKEHTFSNDDGANRTTADTCKRYVEKWPEMLESNIGILLTGDVGTGKSFMAGCVANALIKKNIMAGVTSLPQILSMMQSATDDERVAMVRNLGWFDLLVIDDLGTERETSTGLERVYHVINSRMQSGKPVVVTTNLSMKELESPSDMAYKRIYDRILGMCPIRITMTGLSRRAQEAQERRIKAIKSLGYKEQG
jgi:DNA replication protein DnaC